jgi:hypothetical protein
LRFLRAVSRTGSTVAEACALGVNRTKVARRIMRTTVVRLTH